MLQSIEVCPIAAGVEYSKWLWSQNLEHEAIVELQKTLNIIRTNNGTNEISLEESKAHLRLANWLESTNGSDSRSILSSYLQIVKDTPNWEKSAFCLARYYNRLYESEKTRLKTDSSS